MIKISKRSSELAESVTLAITAKAKEMRAKGFDIISFGAGEPDFDTPQEIKNAAEEAIRKGHTKYTPVGGIPELKSAVIEKFKRDNNLDYSTSEILISSGGKHSFYNLAQALIDPGDEVIIPAPYWVSYPPIIELAGGVAVIVSAKEENGFKMTPDDFKEAITNKTKAVIINSPSNPTGAVYSKSELLPIVEIALKNNILLITDDIYEQLCYGDNSFTCLASLSKEARDNTVVLNGISKTYSMTGWRIGYAAGPENIIKAMTRIQSQSTSNPTSISQWAAVEAIKGSQEKVVEMRSVFKKRRDLMVNGLNNIEGVSITAPDGAFYAFANVSEHYGKKSNDKEIKGSLDLTSYLLENAEVAVVPGIAFGSDPHIRLSFACSEEDIKNGLSRIAKALGELK